MPFEYLFMLLAFLFVLVAIGTGTQSRSSSLDRVYRELAAQRDGTWSGGGWFGNPAARFPHQDTLARSRAAVVDVGSGGQGQKTKFTRVLLKWPDQDFRCEVFPAGTWAKFSRFAGMRDIEIGSPDFDHTYIITSNNDAAVKRLLSHGVQAQVERIRFLEISGEVYMSVNRGTFLVKKRGVIRKLDLLNKYVSEVLELYDQAILAQSAGIQFIDQTRDQVIDDAICQICGDQIDHEIVFCRRCRTPHHKDCWQYYGSCSTYGCQESRYLVPKKARRLPK